MILVGEEWHQNSRGFTHYKFRGNFVREWWKMVTFFDKGNQNLTKNQDYLTKSLQNSYCVNPLIQCNCYSIVVCICIQYSASHYNNISDQALRFRYHLLILLEKPEIVQCHLNIHAISIFTEYAFSNHQRFTEQLCRFLKWPSTVQSIS